MTSYLKNPRKPMLINNSKNNEKAAIQHNQQFLQILQINRVIRYLIRKVLLQLGNQLSQIATSMITPKLRTIILTAAQNIMPVVTTIQQNQSLINKVNDEHNNLQQLLIHEALSKNQSEIHHKEECLIKKMKVKNPPVYKKYSLQFKHQLIEEIIAYAKRQRISQSIAIRRKSREHGIHPKNIYRWYRSKELKRKVSGRKALFPEMESKLMDFILSHPTRSPKRRDILSQARKILDDLQIEGREDFNFSKGWYQRFRERMNKMANIDISPLEPLVGVVVSERQWGESTSKQFVMIEKSGNKVKEQEIESCLMETVKIETGYAERSRACKGKRGNGMKVEADPQCDRNQERHSVAPQK